MLHKSLNRNHFERKQLDYSCRFSAQLRYDLEGSHMLNVESVLLLLDD